MKTREVALAYFDIVDGPDIATAKSLNVIPDVSIDQGKIDIEDQYKTASRNALGNLRLKYSGKTIHKISITWGLLTRTEWVTLLEYIKSTIANNEGFYCKVFLPDYGGHRILKMYAGNRSATPYMVNPGNPANPNDPSNDTAGQPRYYKGCSCNFIEM